MDAQWLQKQFELNPDKSKSGLAKILDLEPSAISKILNEQRQIKAHEYMSMRSYFGLPNDGHHATALKKNQASNTNTFHESGQDDDSSQWLMPHKKPGIKEEEIKIYKIRENSLAPDFSMGDHVAVDVNDTMPSPAGVFLVSDGLGVLIRHCEIKEKSDPLLIKLSTNDSKHEQQIQKITEFEIIGRVVGKISWL